MKLYQLTVHKTPEEEQREAEEEEEVELPRVDNMKQFQGRMSPLSLNPFEEGDARKKQDMSSVAL